MQRTAALYVAGAWIALQVVEVFAGAGLPPGTMRQLLVALSAAVALRGATFGEANPVVELMLDTEGVPTEAGYLAAFFPDAKVLRQHPQYRALFRDSGLVDYWRKWGWSDYCEPVGEDDFRCD